MAVNNQESIYKKIADDRTRLVNLGITDEELVKYIVACGPEGKNKTKAFAELKSRLQLNDKDAAFAERALGDCARF